MSIPETLLAAVCLLVTCSGIAAMAEDWRDTASANRAAAEFTVTARRAAAWVLSRRTDLAEKAEHAPFSLTELCPETASARNSVTGQPYTAFLFTPETGQLSLALFAAGGSGDREMLRKIIRPAARRIEAGFFVAENGLLVRGNEKLSPASLCSGCGSLLSPARRFLGNHPHPSRRPRRLRRAGRRPRFPSCRTRRRRSAHGRGARHERQCRHRPLCPLLFRW